MITRRGQNCLYRIHRCRKKNWALLILGSSKKLTLELGGKAAEYYFWGCSYKSGGRRNCKRHLLQSRQSVVCAGSRLLVEESVYEEVIRKLKARIETLIVGDPLDKNTDVGAINSREQLKNHRKIPLKLVVMRAQDLSKAHVRCLTRDFGVNQLCLPKQPSRTALRKKKFLVRY